MLERINALKDKFLCKKTFLEKILFFLETAIIITSVLMLLGITAVSGTTITSKSNDMVMSHIDSIAQNIRISLGEFEDINQLLANDYNVQQYLRVDRMDYEKYFSTTNSVKNSLFYAQSSKNYMNYSSLIKYKDNEVLYTGTGWTHNNYIERSESDYENAIKLPVGNASYTVTPDMFHKEEYSLNIYQELRDTHDLETPLGLLGISLGEEYLQSIYESYDSKLPLANYLTMADGTIISCPDKEKILTMSPVAAKLVGDKGDFEQNNRLMFYSHIEEWDWYLVGEIPKSYLLADTQKMFFILLIIVFGICAVCTSVCRRIGRELYRPLRKIVEHLGIVSSGDLATRMEEKNLGEDIEKIAVGFNDMLDQIEILMERVKEEQHQIEQIHLNALQSQIKPHFLYNALDCIHWQAVADGNKEVSKMVRSLATYYRLCLSNGEDIISLTKEVTHIESYITIQNMRYDNIIDCNINIAKRLATQKIPKMTLQPLVENAIYHGIKIKNGQRGTIEISVTEKNGKVVILVCDNGIGMAQEKIDEMNKTLSVYTEGGGYGVRNVNKRIELLFGKEYGLYYVKNEAGGITAEVHLPLCLEML